MDNLPDIEYPGFNAGKGGRNPTEMQSEAVGIVQQVLPGFNVKAGGGMQG